MQPENKNKQRIVTSYRYEDEIGRLLYEVVRLEPKGFYQRAPNIPGADPDKAGWKYNLDGVRKVLYKLPQLIQLPTCERIYIVEGEKDAERLWAEGLPATTNPGGAGNWLDDFNEYFNSKEVIILPDNDQQGIKHAEKVASAVSPFAACVKIVNLPGLSEKQDVSDWLDNGHSFGELSILADDAPQFKPSLVTRTSSLGLPSTSHESRATSDEIYAKVIHLDTVKCQDIQWLWPNRIPLGMITLIVGDPGTGKSFLTLYMAARITSALPWPDGTDPPYGSCLIISAEDSLEHVVCPRLVGLNADLKKIISIQEINRKDKDGSEFSEMFNITTDQAALQRVLCENPDTKLVIIDPISAYFGNTDTHKDSNVRSVLAPLAKLAADFNVAVVCVLHLNKSNSSKAVYRTMGSLAFPAAARTVWLVNPEPGQQIINRRLLIPAKHNILKDPTTLAFWIDDGYVKFDGQPVNITADDVLSFKKQREAPQKQQAADWLADLLADGKPRKSAEIFDLAGEIGISIRTLRKASKEIGVKCYQDFEDDGNRFWYWKLQNDKEEGHSLFDNMLEFSKLPKLPKLEAASI